MPRESDDCVPEPRSRDTLRDDTDTSNRGRGKNCIREWGQWWGEGAKTLTQGPAVDKSRGGGGASGSQGVKERVDVIEHERPNKRK